MKITPLTAVVDPEDCSTFPGFLLVKFFFWVESVFPVIELSIAATNLLQLVQCIFEFIFSANVELARLLFVDKTPSCF